MGHSGYPDFVRGYFCRASVTVLLNQTALLTLELRDADGNVLATGTAGADGDLVIRDFVAPAGGTYYVRIGVVGQEEYSLVFTRDATVETGNNLVAAAHSRVGSPEVHPVAPDPAPAAESAFPPAPSRPASLASSSMRRRDSGIDMALAAIVIDPTVLEGEPLHEALTWDRLMTSRRRLLSRGSSDFRRAAGRDLSGTSRPVWRVVPLPPAIRTAR